MTGAVSIAPTNAPAIVANRSNSGSVIDIQSVGVTRGQIGSVGSNLAISSSGTGGYGRLQDNGTDVAIWWTNGIYPATDNAKNLGVSSGSGRWANLFLASGIYMASSQVLDASRNLLNIGTISSGVITATAASDAVGINLRGRSTDSIGELNFESNTGSNLNSIQSRTTDLRIKTLTNTPLIFIQTTKNGQP